MTNGADPPDPNKEERDAPKIRESPGGKRMGIPGLVFITLYLLVVASLTVHGLIILWPPNLAQIEQSKAPLPGAVSEAEPAIHFTPKGKACKALKQEPRNYFTKEFCVSEEERLLMIVLLAGALGALVHAFRSFSWYVGNRRMVWSWSVMYVVLPFLGATMAFVFYLVIRGGFFSPNTSIEVTSPFGFAALAVLVGMFTNEAAQKLKDVAEMVLAKAEKGKDHISGAPTISKIEPTQGKLAGGDMVTITGTGFAKEATVRFGGDAATDVTVVNETTITVVTPPKKEPGAVPVEVINPGDLKTSFASFTYT